MKRLFLLFLFLPLYLNAQVADDFADGNFTSNPKWHGDSLEFQISTYSSGSWSQYPRLQLDGSVADTSFLYISSAMSNLNNKQWEFWVRLAFNTSKTNNCRVYIVSDNSNFEGSLNGYYIMFGDDNNDQFDSISLWKQTGVTVQKIIAGHTIFTGASSNYRIKVTRDNTANWELFADQSGASNFISIGSGNDNTHNSSAYFGVFCKYTLSNRTYFYFDDIYAGTVIIDTIAPTVQSVSVTSSTQLDILFTEIVDQPSSENVNNYNVAGIGIPISATKDIVNGAMVHLVFSTSFTEGIVYSLDISNVQDLSGNVMLPVSKPFSYYNVVPFDIVINEIMADPDPPVGLPNYEYLELFNQTQIPINLKNWTISIGSSTQTLPEITILPDSFLIITGNNAMLLLSSYGPCIGLSSFSVTNTGTTITLNNINGDIIHFLTYTDKWYQNTLKDEGGWSLELIDPLNPCGEMSNWKASADPSGGTPGKVNSVKADNPDLLSPVLIRASANRYQLNRVKIFFNEAIDSVSMKDVEKYNVNNSIGNPSAIHLIYPDNKSAELFFSQTFQPNIIYILTVSDSIFDCVGNKISMNQTVSIGIPATADSADLVINEILFDPKDNGVDFVEIYNRSNKVLDFMDLNLLSLTDSAMITSDNYLILPGSYTVLTTNPDMVKSQYYTPNPYAFITMESFPSLNNDEGAVILSTNTDTVVDAFSYTSDMQFPLLNSSEGVSLERVSYGRPAGDITNWHSASETVGFATPAYLNSQFMAGTEDDGNVSVEPEIFSPDNDGYNDVLNIRCKTDAPGKMLNITIYDSKGRLIKCLIKNQLMSTGNVYSWDGINDNNQKANIGIYIVYVEILDMKGNVNHYKKTVVLATKL